MFLVMMKLCQHRLNGNRMMSDRALCETVKKNWG